VLAQHTAPLNWHIQCYSSTDFELVIKYSLQTKF